MKIDGIGPGYARLSMEVRTDMLTATASVTEDRIRAADSAFRLLLQQLQPKRSLHSGCSIDYLSPSHAGDLLTAERQSNPRRTYRCVRRKGHQNQNGQRVAYLEGSPIASGEKSSRKRQRGETVARRDIDRKGLEPIECASRDKLQSTAMQRLKWSLLTPTATCRTTKKTFDAAGVVPRGFARSSDLRNFRFLTKKDFRDNYQFGLFAVPGSQISRIHAFERHHGKTDSSRVYRRISKTGRRLLLAPSGHPADGPGTPSTSPTDMDSLPEG